MGGERVCVHIGLAKTGTTYLQECLHRNRETLREQGWLYPGSNTIAHWLATLDLQSKGFEGHKFEGQEGAWGRLVAEISGWDQDAIISHELLATCKPETVRRLQDDLAPRQVDVLITVRDLSRVIPAGWQEEAKNGRTESWKHFLDGVSGGPEGGHEFWNLHALERILSRWTEVIPPERIHVVTVPPPGGSESLLSRFLGALDVDAAGMAEPAQTANQSIGAVEVAIVHQINQLLGKKIGFKVYHQVIKHRVVPNFLARRPNKRPIMMPPSSEAWVSDLTNRRSKTISDLGCRVVGTLDDLQPTNFAEDYQDPDDVSPEELNDSLARLTIDLARQLDKAKRQRRRRR